MAQITLRDYLQETEDAISSSHVDDALARADSERAFVVGVQHNAARTGIFEVRS